MATKLGTIVADFRTTLATEIAIGGTSATLQSATDSDGVALPAGTYYLTLDKEGSQKEHIVCSLSGTALTSIKTVSRQGVQASGTVRKHRIGASVEITDFAHIMEMNNLLAGTTDLNASVPLSYDGTATLTPGSNELATVAYADALTFAGAPDGSTSQKGIYEEATVAEQGTATATGSTGARLIVANANLVKTSSGAGDENKIAVLDASGQFDAGFIADASTTLAGKAELATGAETAAGTATGGTGSPLVPANSSFTATSSGSADANKVGVLGSAGTLADGFMYITGTSGEAITAGQGVYIKASDSKLYKSQGTGDEATFSFVGVAADTAGAADVTIRVAPPGSIFKTTGLTAGAYYFVSDTAGTLATTPGTRFARVGLALSTTRLLVITPKYIRRGSFTVSGTGDTSVTTGFYPAHVQIRAGVGVGTAATAGFSVGDDSNNCVLLGSGASGGNSLVNGAAAQIWLQGGTAVLLAGTVSAKSATGFTWNTGTYSTNGGQYSSHTIQWAAFSE